MPTRINLPFTSKPVLITTAITFTGIFSGLLLVRYLLSDTGTVLPLLALSALSIIIFIGSPIITRLYLNKDIGENEILKAFLIVPLALITLNLIDFIDQFVSNAAIQLIAIGMLSVMIHLNSAINFTQIDRVDF